MSYYHSKSRWQKCTDDPKSVLLITMCSPSTTFLSLHVISYLSWWWELWTVLHLCCTILPISSVMTEPIFISDLEGKPDLPVILKYWRVLSTLPAVFLLALLCLCLVQCVTPQIEGRRAAVSTRSGRVGWGEGHWAWSEQKGKGCCCPCALLDRRKEAGDAGSSEERNLPIWVWSRFEISFLF